MGRWLVIAGIVLVVAGLAWPWVTRLGLGHLPGDIIIQKGNVRFYFPLMTSIVVSIVLSLLIWLFNR